MTGRVLICEDNALNLKLFTDLLRGHGYSVEPIADGREAVAAARRFAPDLIIMDIQMPHVSGLELIDRLKADPALAPVPILAVTAYAGKGDEDRIMAAGAAAYVSKPMGMRPFLDAVAACLRDARAAATPLD